MQSPVQIPDEVKSLAQRMAEEGTLREFVAGLKEEEKEALKHNWKFWGRPAQQKPPGDWYTWLMKPGRGWGKTAAGAHFVHEKAWELPGSRGGILGRTGGDVRVTMMEGVSGILNTQHPRNPCVYKPSTRTIKWANGTEATTFSADKPDQTRGPNLHWAWLDEFAAFKRYEDELGATAYDNITMGTRLEYRGGIQPQVCLTTTPRPIKTIKEMVADTSGATYVTHGTMWENWVNLAPAFRALMLRKYQGTRLGRQELEGAILAEVEGALVTMDMIHDHRLDVPEGGCEFVFIGVDPAGRKTIASDKTGIVVVGVDRGEGYIIENRTDRYSSDGWAAEAVRLYRKHSANMIVAEENMGWDLVSSNIAHQDKSVIVEGVVAFKGKHLRFGDVSSLWEQGRIHHVEESPPLEEQICSFTALEFEGEGSPDDTDATVHALKKAQELGLFDEVFDDEQEIQAGDAREDFGDLYDEMELAERAADYKP